MTLAYAAAVTRRVRLGTEVLVLPQRDPVLVAKQVSTLDTLSAGRVRLGVGVGWQASEYEALGEDFTNRGRRMDEALALLRACWTERSIDFTGSHYHVRAMGMEPKPPQGRALPVWIGGNSEAAYRRVGRHGDGWLGSRITDAASAKQAIESIHRHAVEAGRDPGAIGLQSMVAPPPRSEDGAGKRFYADTDAVVRPGGRSPGDGLRVGRDQRHRHLPGRRAERRRDDRPPRRPPRGHPPRRGPGAGGVTSASGATAHWGPRPLAPARGSRCSSPGSR